MASAMLVEQRLQGSIDQVEQLIHFACAAAMTPAPRSHPPHPHPHPPLPLARHRPRPRPRLRARHRHRHRRTGRASSRCGRSDSRSDALHAFDTQIEHICRSAETIASAITKKQLPQLAKSS